MAKIPTRSDLEDEAILEFRRRENEEVRERLRRIKRKLELLDKILERKRKAREEQEKLEQENARRKNE